MPLFGYASLLSNALRLPQTLFRRPSPQTLSSFPLGSHGGHSDRSSVLMSGEAPGNEDDDQMVWFLRKILDDMHAKVQEASEGEELRNLLHEVAHIRLDMRVHMETQKFMAELIVMEAKLLDAHVSKPFVTVMSELLEEYMRIESSMGDDRNSGFKSMMTAFRKMHQILAEVGDSKLAGDALSAEGIVLKDHRSHGRSIQDRKRLVDSESKSSSAIRDVLEAEIIEIRRCYEQRLEERTFALRNECQQHLDGAAAQFRELEQLLAEKTYAIEQYKGQLERSITLWRESSDRCSSLQKRAETAESALQQYSLVDTALYTNEASPSLLQSRANAVKRAIQCCAGIVARISQQDSLAVAYPLHIVSCSAESCVEEPKLMRYRKLGMQAVLCQCLFEGFESSTFNIGESTFERPKNLKQKRLQAYNKYVDEDPDSLAERNSEFRTFLHEKWELLLQKLTDILSHEEPKLMRYRKLGMQAVLCQCLFEGFESSTFNIGESTFERPKNLKQKRLQAYNKYVDEDPDSLAERNSEFRTFLHEKWELLLQKLTDILSHEEPRNVRDRLQAENTNLTGSFGRLAMSVWLLHLVAFACEPSSAEMFRVSPKSSFDEEYMKEHEDIQTADHANNTHPEARIVACMTVPGFTVRSSIVKADVCCAHSLI